MPTRKRRWPTRQATSRGGARQVRGPRPPGRNHRAFGQGWGLPGMPRNQGEWAVRRGISARGRGRSGEARPSWNDLHHLRSTPGGCASPAWRARTRRAPCTSPAGLSAPLEGRADERVRHSPLWRSALRPDRSDASLGEESSDRPRSFRHLRVPEGTSRTPERTGTRLSMSPPPRHSRQGLGLPPPGPSLLELRPVRYPGDERDRITSRMNSPSIIVSINYH